MECIVERPSSVTLSKFSIVTAREVVEVEIVPQHPAGQVKAFLQRSNRGKTSSAAARVSVFGSLNCGNTPFPHVHFDQN